MKICTVFIIINLQEYLMKMLYAVIILSSASIYAAEIEKEHGLKLLLNHSSQKAPHKKARETWTESFIQPHTDKPMTTEKGTKYAKKEDVSYRKDSEGKTHATSLVINYTDGTETHIFYNGLIDGIYPASEIPDSVKKRRAEKNTKAAKAAKILGGAGV
jgi:hypothetical protein